MGNHRDTLTFQDAVRLAGPMAFNIMLKPAGSLCNLSCRYCYYLDKSEIYGGREPRMTDEMLEHFVKEYIDANEVDEVTFNWHGGEPLLMGLDFYRKALECERKYANGKRVNNTLQTNGILLDDEWCKFLRDNGFLVGVSIDGPEDIHDAYRRDRGGAPTFARVIRGVEKLYRHGVEYNTMTTVNKASEGRGLDVYRFMKSIGSWYMQFMPVVEHINEDGRICDPSDERASLAPWCVGSKEYGQFLCDIFDHWVRNDVGRYFVGQFDAVLASWCGVQPGICAYCETCGGNSVVEHNGDIYPCDHFVYPQYRIGNMLETSLKELMTSDRQVRFGISKRNGLPEKCIRCRWFFACHGECPKHRFNKTESGETGLSALCEGHQIFYGRVAPYMDRMRALLEERKSPAGVMIWAREQKI